MASYVSSFGVERVYGLGEGVDKFNATSAEGMAGSLHEIVCPLSLTGPDFNRDANNDGTNDSFGRGVANVPEGATIDTVDVKIEEVAGLSALTIGLYEKDGTVIDADGLYKTADGLTVGVHAGTGDLIGTLMAKTGYIKATGNTAATNLKGFIIVRYIA
jgi:hypothetical protein